MERCAKNAENAEKCAAHPPPLKKTKNTTCKLKSCMGASEISCIVRIHIAMPSPLPLGTEDDLITVTILPFGINEEDLKIQF